MNENEEIEMEVFRAGDYGLKGRYTEAELDSIANDYSPELHEAPLTLDHAQCGPAFGWVSSLRRAGDRLVAVIRNVPEKVRELLGSGAFRKRSIELIRSFGTTGRPYLRAVSLLGAASPEVKGLRDVQFATDDSTEVLRLGQPEEPAPAADDHEKSARKADALFSQMRSEGVVLNDQDRGVLGVLFHETGGQVELDQNAVDLDAWLKDLLRRCAVKVPLGESAATPIGGLGTAPDVAEFSERADPRSVQLHHMTLQLMCTDPDLSYAAALSMAARK